MPNLSIPPSGFDRQQVVLVPEHIRYDPKREQHDAYFIFHDTNL